MDNERFIELLEEAGYSHRAYSGRGMFGEYCIGASTKGDAAGILSDILTHCEITNEEQVEVAKIFKNKRTDDLGRGTIVYFPAMKWEEAAQ
jgi:hypothetical protein